MKTPYFVLSLALLACAGCEINTTEEITPERDADDVTVADTAATDSGTTETDTEVADAAPDTEEADTSDTGVVDTGLADTMGDTESDTVDDVADTGGGTADTSSDTDADTGDVPDCELGTLCRPIQVTSFPFVDSRDTREAPSDEIDDYACAPDTREWGGEFVYEVRLESRGLLTAALDDVSGDGVDIDVHLLRGDGSCVVRDNVSFGEVLDPGTYLIVADTWTRSDGEELAGPYELTLRFVSFAEGACAMDDAPLRMVWSSCADGIACYEDTWEDGNTYRFLRLPAYGPVVREAHLVTEEDGFGGGWPTSAYDQVAAHYARSEAATGYAMDRGEPWAPAGEGGSQWGQGSTGAYLPVVAETWYVNMYWRDRPDRGTPMLILNPENGRAVVAAGGYETGPGDPSRIGGVTEEIHHYLGTTHLDPLVIGFLRDDALPYGPVSCDE